MPSLEHERGDKPELCLHETNSGVANLIVLSLGKMWPWVMKREMELVHLIRQICTCTENSSWVLWIMSRTLIAYQMSFYVHGDGQKELSVEHRRGCV